MNDGPLLPHGGYRKLRSYKVAEVVYDDHGSYGVMARGVSPHFFRQHKPEKSAGLTPTLGQVAEVVYDATVVFCGRFLAQDRRLVDQMVQAARSGVRNMPDFWGCSAYPECRGIRP